MGLGVGVGWGDVNVHRGSQTFSTAPSIASDLRKRLKSLCGTSSMIHLGQQLSVSSNSCAQTFWCTHPSQPFSSDLTSCSFYLDLLCCCLYVWTAILFSNAGFPQLLYFCNHPVCALIFRKPSSDEPWMLFHTSGKKKTRHASDMFE